MNKPVLIVESPTKVSTLKKYIGQTYKVAATVGHLKDLPPKEMGIDIAKDFKAKYLQIKGKQKIIQELKNITKDANDIYLAPDPDREGEAIAFHISEILKKKGRKFHRVLIHELTKNGIAEAFSNIHDLNRNRYDAQQARRILDRLVGYQLSPLLWRKVSRGLSAGRVQSVSLRIICERERLIQAFNPEEYWTIDADLEAKNPPVFKTHLVKKNGDKINIPNEKKTKEILDQLSNEQFIIEKMTQKTKRRNPLPPFNTSKLQQEAINKLKFSAKKTMTVAQQLYEGIDLGPGEPEGLITYMRTDSLRISEEVANEALKLINEMFGKEYAEKNPRFFKNKNKVQDAHEAIRPTSVYNIPEKIASYLSKDQLALYALIWKKFLASQMTQALLDQNSISIKAGIYTFSVTGSTIKFPGFMSLYMSNEDHKEKSNQELPELSEKMILKVLRILPKQHFTKPLPRFSEASLVKELEEKGIGRPSTYTNILSTIREKGYVDYVNKYFKPSELGFIVNDLLVDNFPDIMDVAFTAKMENNLDLVETGDTKFTYILNEFYGPFNKELESAKDNMLSVKGIGVNTGKKCPRCKKENLHIKVGKNGPFLACNGYPDCNYSRNYDRDEKGIIHPIESSYEMTGDKICEKCGSQMIVKNGRYGEFFACSSYPNCKHTKSLHSDSLEKTIGVKCSGDNCGGEIVQKKSKRGKIFYGCNHYPECTFATWDKPIDKECPICKAKFLVKKSTKREGDFLKCLSVHCSYKEYLKKEIKIETSNI